MDIDERKIKILQAIVDDYISTGDPIGSRTIAKKYDLGISPATIRNEMADLEEMGYLVQLYTSSGRIPSDKGYRLYVDQLMQPSMLLPQEKALIKSALGNDVYELEKIMKSSSMLLSGMTKLTCVIKAPSLNSSVLKSMQVVYVDKLKLLLVMVTDAGVVKNAFLKVDEEIDIQDVFAMNKLLNEFLDTLGNRALNTEVLFELKNTLAGNEDMLGKLLRSIVKELEEESESEIYVDGLKNLFDMQEYKNVDKATEILNLLESSENVQNLMRLDDDLTISIGHENSIVGAKECSVIKATYKIGERPIGTIGLIGPTRIPYSRVVAILKSYVEELNSIITKRLE